MQVRLRLSDADLAEDLLDFLRRRNYVGDRKGEWMIEVTVPRGLDEKDSREELSFYLYIWQSLRDWSTHVDIE
jgi:hypothetical protein